MNHSYGQVHAGQLLARGPHSGRGPRRRPGGPPGSLSDALHAMPQKEDRHGEEDRTQAVDKIREERKGTNGWVARVGYSIGTLCTHTTLAHYLEIREIKYLGNFYVVTIFRIYSRGLERRALLRS